MPGRTIDLPKSGFALEIDGRLKTEFSTKEGAEHGAMELKRRFPMLQIRIYDASALSLSEPQSCWQLISNRAMLLPYARGL
jgi:hypothetical protein